MAGIAVLDNMQKGLTALPGVKGIITVQNATALPVSINKAYNNAMKKYSFTPICNTRKSE